MGEVIETLAPAGRVGAALRAVLACALLMVEGAAAAPIVEFIHITANTGNSSGGHAAIRLEDRVYHYQADPDHHLLLARDSWEFFRRRYAMLDNRTMHLSRLDVTPEIARMLKARLDRLHVAQQRQFDRRSALELELRWLTALESGAGSVSVARLGMFGEISAGSHSNSEYLKQLVVSEHGVGWLEAALADVESEITSAALAVSDPGDDLPRPGVFPSVGEIAAERLRDRLYWREALDVLIEGRGIAGKVLAAPGSSSLLPLERAELESMARRLEASVVRLLKSPRPDRGEALLVSQARYAAVRRSLQTDRLVLLDAAARDIEVLNVAESKRHRALAENLAAQARDVFRDAREEAFGDGSTPLGEAEYARLERLSARYVEIRDAVRDSRVLKVSALPGRRGKLVSGMARLPRICPEQMALAGRAREESEARLRRFHDLLEDVYGYELLHHNCCTELLIAIHSAFPDGDTTTALGGNLAAEGFLFIPGELASQVRDHWNVSATREILSRRRRRVRTLAARGNRGIVQLRESNTVTSTAYPGSIDDDAFLFFADGRRFLRPAQGIANIGYGLVHSGVGVLAAPFDRGRRVRAGLRGMFYSVPELVGMNIRKGRYDMAPRAFEK